MRAASRWATHILSSKAAVPHEVFQTLIFERYGAFTDRTLELRADARLHVVLGANEAGKTSALCAIGDLLFGFGKTMGFGFLHDETTLRIGARLRLQTARRSFVPPQGGKKRCSTKATSRSRMIRWRGRWAR